MCLLARKLVRVGVDVGIVEGTVVVVEAPVGGAVGGGHLEPTSQHNSWLNELAYCNIL